MEKMFSFEIAESWGAVAKTISHYARGPSLTEDCPGMKAMRAKWLRAKRPLLERLGDTGRLVCKLEHIDMACNAELLEAAVAAARNFLNNRRTQEKYAADERADAEGLVVPYIQQFNCNELRDNRLGWALSIAGRTYPAGTRAGSLLRTMLEAQNVPAKVVDLAVSAFSVATESLRGAETTLVLSVNPLDILLASEHIYGPGSCHGLNGGHATGTWAYLHDPHTAVAYAYTSSGSYFPAGGIVLPHKIWRQLVYFDLDSLSAFAMREYPSEKPLLARELRRVVAHVLADVPLAETVKWYVMRINTCSGASIENPDNDIDSDYGTIHVLGDWCYVDDPTARVRLQGGAPPECYVGAEEIICPVCGEWRSGGSTRELVCDSCDRRVECDYCNEAIYPEDATETPDGYVCQQCLEDYYTRCCGCDDLLHRDDVYYCDGEYAYCEGCYEELGVLCDGCGEVIMTDRDHYEDDADGNSYCETCADALETCPQCGEVCHPKHRPMQFVWIDEELVRLCMQCLHRLKSLERLGCCQECGASMTVPPALCPECIDYEGSEAVCNTA